MERKKRSEISKRLNPFSLFRIHLSSKTLLFFFSSPSVSVWIDGRTCGCRYEVKMTKKLLMIAREGLSFRSNSKLRPTCLSLTRSPKSVPVNNSVEHTNIQLRGWSHVATAAAPSDKSNGRKARKKVSRDERRAMVESFVNEYRAINAGKFPRFSDAKKQVGGSYYVVRKIIQELEYKSKMNSSNDTVENMAGKEIFDEEKPLTTESAKVSSGKIETAIDGSVQKDFQSVDIDKDIANADYEHLEESRGMHSNSWERSMSQEAVISTASGGHFTVADSKSLKRDAEELSQSSLQMTNEVKTEETESNGPDSISPESHLLKEEIEHVSASYGKKSSVGHCEAQSHDWESLNMEGHLRKEEESVEKSGHETREQAALEELPEEPSQSSVQLTSDVKAEKAESSLSDSVAPESHPLKEEIEQPDCRETRDAEVSRKSTLWGNLKSFADGIMNIWRRL